MPANAPRISLLHIRNLREQDSCREKTVYVVQSTEEQDGWEYRRGTGWHARDIDVNKKLEKGNRKSK